MPYLSPYIETLRQKPLHVRQRHTLFWSVALTVLIVGGWWSAASLAEEPAAAARAVAAEGPLERLGQVVAGEMGQIARGADILLSSLSRSVIVK